MSHIHLTLLVKFVLLFYSNFCQSQSVDYWSVDFDENKNCENEDEILRLSHLNPSQCQRVYMKDEEEASFRKCKTQLTSKLQEKCEYSKVGNPGHLLYCKVRHDINCCYSNATCSSWSDIRNSIYEKAKEYLNDKKRVLENLVKSVGYKTCHHLDSLDATKCAEDCQRMEEEEFAKNCTSGGGLFKCCIRRDKRSCNECKFCCTLPMCTLKPGKKDDTYFDGMTKLELKSQTNELKANEIYFSDKHIYKTDDYHCLKPDSHDDPKKWQKYEMQAYRQAFNLETLRKVQTFKYDKYLYNFADPKVFKAYTKRGKKAKKLWKNSWGYQYTKMIPGHYARGYHSLNVTACIKRCIKMQKSKFAKRCTRNGGYFKCCVSYRWLDSFAEARNKLIKDGLINDTPEDICDDKAVKNPCMQCSTNGVCTNTNPMTGEITQLFFPNKKPPLKSRLDGATSNFRFIWCLILDLCQYHKLDMQWYDNKLYQEAISKEQVCHAGNKGKNEGTDVNMDEDRCSRMYTGNIIKCSKEDKSIADSEILLENKMIIQELKSTKKRKRKLNNTKLKGKRKNKKTKKKNKKNKKKLQDKEKSKRKKNKSKRKKKKH